MTENFYIGAIFVQMIAIISLIIENHQLQKEQKQ